MSLLSRLISKVAVVACESCEGASGAHFEISAGTVRVCRACQGTGEAREPDGTVVHIFEAQRKPGLHTDKAA